MAFQEEKNPAYWEGVRDTLQLLLEFEKWIKENPESEISLEDYLKKAQEQVASKTSPQLADILGVPFRKS